jgi:hypothetical protein
MELMGTGDELTEEEFRNAELDLINTIEVVEELMPVPSTTVVPCPRAESCMCWQRINRRVRLLRMKHVRMSFERRPRSMQEYMFHLMAVQKTTNDQLIEGLKLAAPKQVDALCCHWPMSPA